jgi:hypothetical protein
VLPLTTFNPFIIKLTLCSPKMEFTPYLMLSLLTQCVLIFFFDLTKFKDLLFLMSFKPKKRVVASNTPLINFLSSNWSIWMFTQTSPYTIVPMPFWDSKGQNGLCFLSWLFFFFKKFQVHCKGCKHPPF